MGRKYNNVGPLFGSRANSAIKHLVSIVDPAF